MIATALPDGIPRPLLVGFSGGLDSSVLLHLLAASPLRAAGLRAIHVHHGLQADADAWAAHCHRTCEALGIPLTVAAVTVRDDRGEGREAAARHARHAAFASHLREGEVLVLAHHRDDQAETFLLRALRGSGADALGAMRAWRAYARGWLWRPLLDVPRMQLLDHARQHGLAWIDDPANLDLSLDRNFLRARVLPLLRERWPQAGAALARSAMLSAEAGGLLAREDAVALAQVRGADPQVLDVTLLSGLPAARRARVLRRWVGELALPPLPGEGVAAVERDLLGAGPDAEAEFAWAGAVIRRWRGLLHAGWRHPALPADWRTAWDGRVPLRLPTGGVLALVGTTAPAALDATTIVHARHGGERITLPGRTHSHALKHVLQELGVPPWERARMPLLSDATGELLAAGDLVHSAGFDAWLRRHGLRLEWRPEP